jgi:hypothetical protein
VTVPRDAANSSLLWSRYAGVLGVEPTAYDIAVPRKNVSLGVVESELLRRLHARRDYRFTDPDRHAWTRKLLAAEILGQRRSAPIATPEKAQTWLEERSASMLDGVLAKGYDVIGTLDDLRWEPPPSNARSVSSVTDEEIADAATWTVQQLQALLATRYPHVRPPNVPAHDPLGGVLDLLEVIRAADTGTVPRPPEGSPVSDRTFTMSPLKIAMSYLKRP